VEPGPNCVFLLVSKLKNSVSIIHITNGSKTVSWFRKQLVRASLVEPGPNCVFLLVSKLKNSATFSVKNK
jgi:hypothetical protein